MYPFYIAIGAIILQELVFDCMNSGLNLPHISNFHAKDTES